MERREVVKSLSMLPLVGGFASIENLITTPQSTKSKAIVAPKEVKLGREVYESIGVEPVINCIGTFTIIGGSTQKPEVRAAADAASQYYVQLDELATAVGQQLADLTGAEWGIVSSGATAGLKIVAAACISGGNPDKLIRIPDLSGFEKTEVIMPTLGRNPYDHSIRNLGVKVINVDTLEELEDAISPRTALIEFMTGNWMMSGQPMSVENIARIAKPKNIPILIDAAAEMLMVPNIYLQAGASVVAYSGGKALCGPQCAGLLIGNKDLLMATWQSASPHHGPCRDNKVGREEYIAMLAAVKEYLKRDHAAEEKTWLTWLNNIANRVSSIESVKTTVTDAQGINNRSSRLTISWDSTKLNITGQDVQVELGKTKPRIALNVPRTFPDPNAMPKLQNIVSPVSGTPEDSNRTGVAITAWMMQPGDDKIVAERIYEILSRKRSPISKEMKPPTATITGRWDATIEYAISKSQHVINIDNQDGNWLQGTHKGDFAERVLLGTIEGDQIILRSNYRIPGDSITYIFTGTVSGDTMSGNISMGEYLLAKFTAKRVANSNNRDRIRVPVSPPLMG